MSQSIDGKLALLRELTRAAARLEDDGYAEEYELVCRWVEWVTDEIRAHEETS